MTWYSATLNLAKAFIMLSPIFSWSIFLSLLLLLTTLTLFQHLFRESEKNRAMNIDSASKCHNLMTRRMD